VVLHPITADQWLDRGIPPAHGFISAWQAVERKQKQPAEDWWLIAQPDHAALAGDLAACLNFPKFPKLDQDVIRAITLHDAGWAQFDGGERGTGRHLEAVLHDPQLNDEGRPLSFLDVKPAKFVKAWTDSIVRAGQAGPIGGLIVSEHFCRLARNRLESGNDEPADTRMLQEFLNSEGRRQGDLQKDDSRSAEEIAFLTDILQFCDLLSLYLCCGAWESVEFPHQFNGCVIQLSREGEMCRIEPSIFGPGISLGVTARRYPCNGRMEITVLPCLLG
jgi:hypothetical protein